MADEPKDPENDVNEPQESPATDQQREVREPDNERWWENPGNRGEVH
jgi:hypothetical protein